MTDKGGLHFCKRNQDNWDISLSKALSWLLRHGAIKEGVHICDEGYIDVQDILSHKTICKYSLEDIRRVVETNDKKRFTLREDSNGKLFIKADQGHSIKAVENLELVPILNACQMPVVVHGTYHQHWKKIKTQGLSRMNRIHIHFANGEPGASNVISGMRLSSDVYIYIDIEKALKGGIQFFLSPNNVILSPGNSHGIIEPKYFLKVFQKDKNLNIQRPKYQNVKQ